MSNADNDHNEQQTEGCVHKMKHMNAQVKGLVLSAVLFGALSTAQIVYALIGNSLALLADASAMWVDVVLYVTAIGVEVGIPSHKTKKKRLVTLVVSFLSMGILLGLTLKFTVDGITGISSTVSVQNSLQAAEADKTDLQNGDTLLVQQYNDSGTIKEVDLDSLDVFGRAVVGGGEAIGGGIGLPWLVAKLENRSLNGDGTALMRSNLYNGISFRLYDGILPSNVTHSDGGCANLGAGTRCDTDDTEDEANGTIMIVFGLLGMVIDLGCLLYGVIMPKCKKANNAAEDDGNNEELNANTMAAYAHVAADLIRSTATIVAAILILTNTGAAYADDGASVVANVTIILGCVLGFWEWKSELKEHYELCKEEEEKPLTQADEKNLSSTNKNLSTTDKGLASINFSQDEAV